MYAISSLVDPEGDTPIHELSSNSSTLCYLFVKVFPDKIRNRGINDPLAEIASIAVTDSWFSGRLKQWVFFPFVIIRWSFPILIWKPVLSIFQISSKTIPSSSMTFWSLLYYSITTGMLSDKARFVSSFFWVIRWYLWRLIKRSIQFFLTVGGLSCWADDALSRRM